MDADDLPASVDDGNLTDVDGGNFTDVDGSNFTDVDGGNFTDVDGSNFTDVDGGDSTDGGIDTNVSIAPTQPAGRHSHRFARGGNRGKLKEVPSPSSPNQAPMKRLALKTPEGGFP